MGPPFLDAASFECRRADLPPAAGVDRNGFDAGVDVAELVSFLAGTDHAGNKGEHGGEANGSPLTRYTQALPYMSNSFYGG